MAWICSAWIYEKYVFSLYAEATGFRWLNLTICPIGHDRWFHIIHDNCIWEHIFTNRITTIRLKSGKRYPTHWENASEKWLLNYFDQFPHSMRNQISIAAGSVTLLSPKDIHGPFHRSFENGAADSIRNFLTSTINLTIAGAISCA